MLPAAQLIDAFRSRGVVQAGELYLGLTEALDLVSFCAKNDLAVVGVEGFEHAAGTLTPQLDMIADCSGVEADAWQTFRESSNRCARAFLRSLPQRAGLVVNLTVLSEDEWIAA